MSKTRILLKLTGTILQSSNTRSGKAIHDFVVTLAEQLKVLHSRYHFGIVIGGGNFFRGDEQGVAYGISSSVGHQVGMLATVMNGFILQDIFRQVGIESTILSAQPLSGIGIAYTAHQENIDHALANNRIIIFAGGTGAPFFTTDTTAVVRALQMHSHIIWKATTVDGIYSANPHQNTHAEKYAQITYNEAIAKELGVMDLAAFVLAYKHKLQIRVFNIFDTQALIRAAEDISFGTLVS